MAPYFYLGGFIADLPVEETEQESDCNVWHDPELRQGSIPDDGEEGSLEQDPKLGPVNQDNFCHRLTTNLSA